MPKPLLIAATYARPGRVKDLLDCYEREHLPDVRQVPGMGEVTLYRVIPYKMPDGVAPPDAFILHEIEGDPTEVIAELARRSQTGEVRHTDALDGARSIAFAAIPEQVGS